MATPILKSVLGIDGGKPVRTISFSPWPHFNREEVEAAAAVLRSGKVNYWTGEEGRLFEHEHAAFTGTKYAIAMANGTVALEIALFALGISAGDEVITSSRTFIASASCAVMRGAIPVLADVDPVSGNITAETIRPLINSKTKAIIVVHLGGWPCDMDPIVKLAREHNLKVIEDCAQSNGATYKGRPVGSIGDINAFSFCQDKIMTTGGEGGMLTTNNEELWNRAWSFKDHGKSFDAIYRRQHPPGFRWLHESFGTNGRMTEMQSAMGRVLLRRVPEMVAARRANADMLTQRFKTIPALRTATPDPEIYHSYYKYYVYVRPEQLREGWTRDRIQEAIIAEGIPCYAGSCSEIYLEKAFPDSMRPAQRWPVARELGETSLMFLVHPTLTATEINDTCAAVAKVMAVATQ